MESRSVLNHSSLKAILAEVREVSNKDIRDEIVSDIYAKSKSLCKKVVSQQHTALYRSDKLDEIFTSRIWGFPIMLLMLGTIFLYYDCWSKYSIRYASKLIWLSGE